MSYDIPVGEVSAEKAIKYNSLSAKRLGIPRSIPVEARDMFQTLRLDPSSEDPHSKYRFLQGVLGLQQYLGYYKRDIDGCYGPNTHEDTVKKFCPVDKSERHIVYNGRRVPLRGIRKSTLIGLDADNNYDISRSGHFTRYDTNKNPALIRRENFIVLHWGGRDVDHLKRYFYGNEKKVSSHFGGDGRKVVQYLDIGVASHHAGSIKDGKRRLSMNQNSIGIDCAQFPQVERLNWYKDSDGDGSDDIHIVDNVEYRAAGNRGLKKILSLDTRTAVGIRELILDLLSVMAKHYIVPRDSQNNVNHNPLSFDELVAIHRGEAGAPTVIAHHHITRTKPDVIGWWASIHEGIS